MNFKSDYIFSGMPEAIRAAAIAVVIAVAQFIIAHDINVVTDWKTYAISLGTAAVIALAQWILGNLPPATPDSLKALKQDIKWSEKQFPHGTSVPPSLRGSIPVLSSFGAPRITLCGHDVDPTDQPQRDSHRLREAAFCGKCTVRLMDNPNTAVTVAFTDRGKRRHFAQAVLPDQGKAVLSNA